MAYGLTVAVNILSIVLDGPKCEYFFRNERVNSHLDSKIVYFQKKKESLEEKFIYKFILYIIKKLYIVRRKYAIFSINKNNIYIFYF